MHEESTPAVFGAFGSLLLLAVVQGAPLDPAGEPAEPRRGGTVTVHLESQLTSLNGLLEIADVTFRLLDELHEPLVRRDWETWEYSGVLAESVDIEDAVELTDGSVVFGRVDEEGDHLTVTPLSDQDHPLSEPLRLAREDVRAVRPGTVYTFGLRDDVLWHDGHPFDVEDVLFTWRCTKNPHVRCDATRSFFDNMVRAERVGSGAVRFFLERPHFLSTDLFSRLVILPAHVFDLADPENPDHDPDASPEQRGRFVNEHPVNQMWIGLGPYRVVARDDQVIRAERFEDYFDPEHGGWVDTIRWRVIRGGGPALQALLEGDLDFTTWVSTEDYFGERTRSPEFTSRFHKGHFYTPVMTYTVWNTARAKFADERVRRALGMCFDWDEFIRSYYRGLARRVTSEAYDRAPTYARDVEPLPYDIEGARALLAEAGWYDRDGDGLIDKDGVAFEIELLAPAGSRTAEVYGQRLRESLEDVGIRLELTSRDYPVFSARVGRRDFDAAIQAWYMPVENDPEHIWHSRWVGANTSNHASLADEGVDALIDALQVEPDDERRRQLFHELHALLYQRQAYMYGVTVPKKFALSRRIRNFQTFAIEPGYSIRRWYLAE